MLLYALEKHYKFLIEENHINIEEKIFMKEKLNEKNWNNLVL